MLINIRIEPTEPSKFITVHFEGIGPDLVEKITHIF